MLSAEGKSAEGKSAEGKSAEGKSAEGRIYKHGFKGYESVLVEMVLGIQDNRFTITSPNGDTVPYYAFLPFPWKQPPHPPHKEDAILAVLELEDNGRTVRYPLYSLYLHE